jgi:hypothetical protein
MKNALAERSVFINQTFSANDANAKAPSAIGNVMRRPRATRNSAHSSTGSAR